MRSKSKRIGRVPVAVLISACLTLAAAAADLSEWRYSQPITLNTSATGANVSGPVQDFPVLIRLHSGNFNFTQAMTDGSDLRFSRTVPPNAPVDLVHQIERWDAAGKFAEVWVKVDDIAGNNADQAIHMHWGHDAPPSPPSGSVFAASNGFIGVWHLGENPGFTANGYKDASSEANHGTAASVASPPAGIPSADAKIGKGALYEDANDHYITIPNESDYDLTQAITLSMWMTVDSWNTNFQTLLAKGDHAWRLTRNGMTGSQNQSYLHFATDFVSGNHLDGTYALNADTWYYVTATYDRVKKKIYVDGVKRDEKSVTAAIATTNSAVHIGNNSEEAWRSWDGFLDEVRVENVARSADWIKLCYQNQRADQKLVKFQSQYFPRSGGPLYGSVSMNDYTLDNVSIVVTKNIVPVPDYVFEPGYPLPSLGKVEEHIRTRGHLPGIPSAAELERDGMDIAGMHMHLLKQVEHFHLYLLDHDKRLRKLEERKSAKP